MKPDIDQLRTHVSNLSDEALLEVRPEDLVEAAREVYESELAARGLSWNEQPGGEEAAGGAEAAADDPSAGLVSIAKFTSVDEARFVRTMLENEGIPAWFIGELTPHLMTGDPMAGLELMTKPEFVEQAQLVLNTEIDEEELARQAEAAAPPPDEEAEGEEEETAPAES
jgi:hypothetical protein